jgi:hypothetical protein
VTDAAAQPAAPATPDTAQAALRDFTGNKEIGAKLLAGDVATRAEFDKLSTRAAGLERRPGAEELSAISSHEEDARNAKSFIKGVRDDGLDVRDEVLKEAIDGTPVSKADHDLAKNWMSRLMADQEQSKKLLAGDIQMREQLFRASTILSANIKKAS